jgi:hypothetical protein
MAGLGVARWRPSPSSREDSGPSPTALMGEIASLVVDSGPARPMVIRVRKRRRLGGYQRIGRTNSFWRAAGGEVEIVTRLRWFEAALGAAWVGYSVLSPLLFVFLAADLRAVLPMLVLGVILLERSWRSWFRLPTAIHASPEGTRIEHRLGRTEFHAGRSTYSVRSNDVRAPMPFTEYTVVARVSNGLERILLEMESSDVDADELRPLLSSLKRASASDSDAVVTNIVLEPGRWPSLNEWVRHLRSAGSGANADHRTAPLREQELWRVVEASTADPSSRAGAAVALSGAIQQEGRKRMRVAAERTHHPKLRIVLEAVADNDGDEQEIVRAVARARDGLFRE